MLVEALKILKLKLYKLQNLKLKKTLSLIYGIFILFLSQCSTPCHKPIPPAENKQAINMRIAEAVMLDGEVFQQPRTPAVKETNMKKKPTMKRATMARLMSRIISKGSHREY